jgi:hypothetical protein
MAVAFVVAAVACGGRAARPQATVVKAWSEEAPTGAEWPPAAPFVTPGERMAYKLTMHELEVASFHIAIGDVSEVEGRQVVLVQTGVAASRIVSMVKKVEDSFAAWIDMRTGRPVLFRSSELADAKDQAIESTDAEVARGDGKTFPVRVVRAEGEIVEQQTVSSHALFDMNGFLIALRSWDVPAGTTATADVVRSRYLWRTQVTMAGFETIVTALGELPAVRIDGVSRRLRRDGTLDPSSDTRHYSMWISDDADRVPLAMVARTDYGDLRMDIVEYLPGTGTPLGR